MASNDKAGGMPLMMADLSDSYEVLVLSLPADEAVSADVSLPRRFRGIGT